MNLTGKTALITGASRGIGRAIALGLARSGADIAVHFNNHQEQADVVCAEIAALGRKGKIFQADLRDETQAAGLARDVLADFGKVDILVNNAGGPVMPRAWNEVRWSDVQSDVDLHVRTALLITQALAPGMMERRWGRIVNIATIYTLGMVPTHLLPYITAKYALLGLTRALSVELAPHGITVNAVSPGVTETELISHLPTCWKEKHAKEIPVGRLATPEDVAVAVTFLASPEAGYVSGVNLPVSGGAF
ncbi:hypothetical protein A3D72_01050 [Candidatus Uhrbacteria bacterium RIFCSPHIGHO2_02_FULL_57_19]|uniref:Short-chain dehydrogenase n=2 Tax=Parcubacteria group TaxID=1794811 RepID=A0A1F6CM35_9BACT|nr:MAG: hypothetical protein A2704_04490 [Candidatus Kaiserbacteria bacterium RIFCSPHIGHO2_01_FULL_54_36b]OGL72406.1 MAG: hypothetical protein A3D72_01050 [Candidatus Uhrbacteria bacterium RIFCSPHIGHO2_02_FULL_57_19]